MHFYHKLTAEERREFHTKGAEAVKRAKGKPTFAHLQNARVAMPEGDTRTVLCKPCIDRYKPPTIVYRSGEAADVTCAQCGAINERYDPTFVP